ncbi:MAG: hypothetical protein M5U26_28790 [Planctomycetota bacterium]|nr:hypothetical protein [Planctomycetota bacterium]
MSETVNWPTNFAPTGAHDDLPPHALEHCLQALDLFGISYFGWPLDNLWGVVMDGDGRLRTLPYRDKGRLPDLLQVQLSAQTQLALPRALDVERVFLFALESLEHLADTPGFNDPVSLCGTLHGPFPVHPSQESQPRSCRGRFCVSRADVLEGLVRAEPFVFHGAGARVRGEKSVRTCHLMLPAGLSESPQARADAVLAYPLPIAFRGAIDNTLLAAALAYDVLAELQDDLRRAEVRGAFPEQILPVPSRSGLETRLRSKGYEIRNGYAYAPAAKPASSWLGRLFDGLLRKREELPPEGSLEEFLRIARHALEGLPGWPTAQAQALRQQCRVLEASWPREGLGGLVRIVNTDDVNLKKGELVLRCKGQKGANAVFRLPAELYRRDGSFDCPMDLEVEWFDDEGGGQICYVPAWKEAYKVHASYSLSGTKTWKTATFAIPDARTDGKLWHGDVGIYFHYPGKRPLRIREVKVRLRRPDYLDAGKQRIQCHLDSLAHLDVSKPLLNCHASEAGLLPYSGWILDLSHGTAQGQVLLILVSDQGQWAFGDEQRTERPDIVRVYGSAYARAGFSGVLPLKGLAPGTYKLFLRLQNGESFVQRELWQRLVLMADPVAAALPPQASNAAAPSEPASPAPVAPGPDPEEPSPVAAGLLHVFYHDLDYPRIWQNDPDAFAEFFSHRGFTMLNADALGIWMKERVAEGAVGSVCVIAQGIAPETVLESKDKNCTFRKYLDAGAGSCGRATCRAFTGGPWVKARRGGKRAPPPYWTCRHIAVCAPKRSSPRRARRPA